MSQAMNEEQWSTTAIRSAVRAVVRSASGVGFIECIAAEQDGGDPVWAEDALINAVVVHLRKAA